MNHNPIIPPPPPVDNQSWSERVCSLICWLDHVDFLTRSPVLRQRLIKRIVWCQWVLTLAIIVVSGILIVATDSTVKAVLGITNTVFAGMLRLTTSFDKDMRDMEERMNTFQSHQEGRVAAAAGFLDGVQLARAIPV